MNLHNWTKQDLNRCWQDDYQVDRAGLQILRPLSMTQENHNTFW